MVSSSSLALLQTIARHREGALQIDDALTSTLRRILHRTVIADRLPPVREHDQQHALAARLVEHRIDTDLFPAGAVALIDAHDPETGFVLALAGRDQHAHFLRIGGFQERRHRHHEIAFGERDVAADVAIGTFQLKIGRRQKAVRADRTHQTVEHGGHIRAVAFMIAVGTGRFPRAEWWLVVERT